MGWEDGDQVLGWGSRGLGGSKDGIKTGYVVAIGTMIGYPGVPPYHSTRGEK